MSKVELTVSPNYVPTWTIVDAVRELFQNALDQETIDPDNKAEWNYNEESCTLHISNKKASLEVNSLLLGHTTKASDSKTIGQFGEGYKIATLVLLRNDKNVVFYNYGMREIWKPRFVKSRKFGTNVLTFFIEKQPVWNAPANANLTIAIENISAEEYAEIVNSNLHIRSDYEVLEETKFGQILDLTGKVFVNGLYVCEYKPYQYGYNFKPEYLRLDRDRKMANDFDLRWMASKMWSDCVDHAKVLELITAGAADVAFLKDVQSGNRWCDLALEDFYDVYGTEAIPVTNQYELEKVPAGRKGVIVKDAYYHLIVGSSSYTHVPLEDELPSTKQQLLDWIASVKSSISNDEYNEFMAIIEDID